MSQKLVTGGINVFRLAPTLLTGTEFMLVGSVRGARASRARALGTSAAYRCPSEMSATDGAPPGPVLGSLGGQCGVDT